MWFRFLESETPRLESGSCYLLVSWAWAGCVTSPLGLNFLICKMGEITATLQGYREDFGMWKCLGGAQEMFVIFSFAFPSEKKMSPLSCKPLPGPFLLCRIVSDEGVIRAVLVIFASLEIEFFSKEVGAHKRKCLSLEPHILQSFIFMQKPLIGYTCSLSAFPVLPFSCDLERRLGKWFVRECLVRCTSWADQFIWPQFLHLWNGNGKTRFLPFFKDVMRIHWSIMLSFEWK